MALTACECCLWGKGTGRAERATAFSRVHLPKGRHRVKTVSKAQAFDPQVSGIWDFTNQKIILETGKGNSRFGEQWEVSDSYCLPCPPK